MKLSKGSLVLYGRTPARVSSVEQKILLDFKKGKQKRVREKDITLLHPGPVEDLENLQCFDGDPQEAWKLLQEESPTLQEVAELVYGNFTPASAWSAYQLLNRTPYFKGSVEKIRVTSPKEVAEENAKKAKEAAQREAWDSFFDRFREGKTLPEDRPFFADLENLAEGRSKKSRLLREMGKAQTPENAHKQLLERKIWPPSRNPYLAQIHLPPLQNTVPPLPKEDRLDLREVTAVAIDDVDTQDPDDALSVEGTRLWVHVADVAALVDPDSPLDEEALKRGSTLYLPEGVVPMLPPSAAEVLGIGVSPESPALSFGIDFDKDGKIANVAVERTLVAAKRYSYGEVEKCLEEPPFASLMELTSLLAQKRVAAGASAMQFPEAKVSVSPEGKVSITPVATMKSRDLVAEAMIAAGQAAAIFATEKGIPIPYLVQFSSGEKLPDFDGSLAAMYARRKYFKRSVMSLHPGPHSGLGVGPYTRVTSPLRRYSDLLTVQQIRAFLEGKPLLSEEELQNRMTFLEGVLSENQRADRFSLLHWKLVFLLQNPHWKGEAVFLGKQAKQGVFFIEELAWEVKVPSRGGDFPKKNEKATLRVSKVDLAEREAFFEIVERPCS